MDPTYSLQQPWPEISYEGWSDTFSTFQLWTQIVGKLRLRKMPWTNHAWHVPLYVSSTGLTTRSIPYEQGLFQLDFNFIRHQLIITTSKGQSEKMDLYPRTVASFYDELKEKMQVLSIPFHIHAVPNEIEPAIPFQQDEIHASYDKEKIYLFWQALVNVQVVFTRFRARFSGKCSPIHFFWGGFDLALSRFNGNKAPLHPGGAPNIPLRVMQESYSHEVCSCGFWPGSAQFPMPAFYCYIYPTPPLFGSQKVLPKEAFYNPEMGEFLLPYEVVRLSPRPEDTLLQFLQSTYEAAANIAGWDRERLEADFSEFERAEGK